MRREPDSGGGHEAVGLRQQAEQRVAAVAPPGEIAHATEELQRLVHELRVRVAELEIINERLRTEHTTAEMVRREYLDRFRRAPVGRLTLGMQSFILKANDAASALLRMPVRDLTRMRLVDFIAPHDLPFYEMRRKRAFESGEPETFELRLMRRNGPPFWAQLDLAITRDEESGAPLCAVSVNDSTDLRIAAESVARLASLIESTSDAIFTRDLRGRVVSWNASAERLFGYSADEIMGRPFHVLVPEERRTHEAQLINRIRQGEIVAHSETVRLSKDGARIAVSLSVSPIYGEQREIVGVSEIARDIRAEKQAQARILDHLRQLDALSSASHTLITGEDVDGLSWTAMLTSLAAALGADATYAYLVADDPDVLQLLAQSASGVGVGVGVGVLPGVIPYADPLSGRVARERLPLVIERLEPSSVEAQALLDIGVRCYAGFPLIARGILLGVAAFGTARERFTEAEYRVLLAVCVQIAAMVERMQLIAELRANETALKDADRRKDDFIATLAHELRNPLAPIRNAAVALRFSGVLDPKFAWCRDVIERQVGVLAELLEDLLDVSRIARRRIELRLERIELGQAISQAVETVRPLIDEMKHQLVVQLPPQTIVLNGDLTRLTQVVGNLLNNAAKYTDRGGRILLSVQIQGREAVIRVQDSGIGIPAEHLPKVFELFSQVETALKRSRGGLGIGLSLVKALVELHGGRVSVDSAGPGQGSEFSVYLPFVELTAPALKPASSVPHARETQARSRRVLVVDDNADVARSMESMLQGAGHDVRVASDGEHAIHLAEQYRPHAVLLDIGMPGMNGYEICRRIREQPWSKEMLIVACTGWGRAADRARAREAGFDHHLVKPADPERLLNLIALESDKSRASASRRPASS